MRSACMLLVLALLPLLPVPALGQNAPRELRGKVFSIEKGEQNPQPFGNVLVTIPSSAPVPRPTTRACSASRSPRPCRPDRK